MSPKILTIIVLIMLWENSIWEIYTPQSFTETLGLFGQFKKEVITVLFVDSAVIGNQLDNENADGSTDNEYGVFSSLFFNVKKMFTSNDKTINDIIKDISKDNILVLVDVTLPDLVQIKDMYNVHSVPFIIIIQGNKILYRDIATK